MTTAVPSTALATIQPAFTDPERLALAGFLAGYRGLTREAYALDLRQFAAWCRARSLSLFAVRRADIEGFARELEARGRARATVTRRLSTIAGFYRYAVEEELLENPPAAHVRRPRVDYESHAVALDRNELGALLVAAGLGPPLEHALISLLALNGLRVSEATGADIEHLGLERGHRTLTITRKGGKVVTIPLAPRTARAIDLAIGRGARTADLRAGRAGGHGCPCRTELDVLSAGTVARIGLLMLLGRPVGVLGNQRSGHVYRCVPVVAGASKMLTAALYLCRVSAVGVRSGFSAQTLSALAALCNEPPEWPHGYPLARQTGLKSGALYPILIRLAHRGLVEACWQDEPQPGRPRRHLYRVTATGLAAAARAGAAEPAARPGARTGRGVVAGVVP